MKKTVVFTLVAASSMAVSMGATSVGVANFAFPATADNGLAIVDNTGTPLTGVNFGVGSLNGALSDAASVRAAFTPLGTSTTTSQFFAGDPNTGNNIAVVDASPQDDSAVYVVFYSGADLATSDDYIVFEGDANFIVENAVLGADVNVSLVGSTLVYGTETTSNGTGINPPFTSFTNGVTFGSSGVPEPSSALLSVLGLAFVARRRR